jgi:serine/threonine-protein kinase RsbW
MRTAIFSAKCENLDGMREFVGQAAQDAGMDKRQTYAVQLAVDEACSNIIEHAYTGKEGEEIEITCAAVDDILTIFIRDHGRPFDPASVHFPDLDADLKKRHVGGLGVYLMRQLMDEVHFETLGEAGNVLTMVKRRKGAK